MARLEGLVIQGIRSFGPDVGDRQVIHFKSPLTLILGQNGCGKTTIIEALKFATVGEYPFGQGAAFVHDPKMAGEVEVKGQIKLEFRSTQKKTLTVTRNLQAIQRPKKIEVSSHDNTLHSRDPLTDQRVNLSSRCADITELMVESLGVSKSVLSNVIFCHQEDSNWPLEEGKKLKERFDEIFESGDHNKCLEEIRSRRKTTVDELKRTKLELSHLKEKKDTAAAKKVQMQDEVTRYREMLEQVEKSKERTKTYEKEYKQLNKENEKHIQLSSELTKKKAQYDSMVIQQDELLKCIKNLFEGSTEQLEAAIKDFAMRMRDKVASRERYENEIRRLRAADDEYMKETNIEMDKIGGLKVEINLHEERIKDRNEKLQNFIEKCELSRLCDFPTESDIHQSLVEAQEFMAELNTRVQFTRNQHDKEEKRLQADLDAKRVTITQLQQEIKSKDAALKSTKGDIKEKSDKLTTADTCASRLGELDALVERIRANVERVSKSVNVEELKAEIETKRELCARLDERQAAVNEEVKILFAHTSSQNKLAELQKQEASLSTTLRKLRNKNKEGVQSLLKNSREGSLNYDLLNIIRNLEETIKRDRQRISVQEQKVSNLTLQRKLKKEQLAKFEEEVKVAQEKIYELCRNKEVEAVIQEAERELQKLQEERGFLSSSENIYKSYINKLKEDDPCCPLCQRNFDNNEDAPSLVLELSSKISNLPSRLRENEGTTQIVQLKLKKLLELRATSARMTELEKRLIPSTKSELTAFEDELDLLNQDLALLKASIVLPEENVILARSMLSDVGVMDQLSNDLKKVNGDIEKTKRLLPPGGLKRTIEEAQAENDVLRGNLAETRQEREMLENQLNKHRESLNSLEQELNQKVTEQLEIKGLLQERVQIEERLFELQMIESTLESERQVLRSKLVPAEAEMEAAEELMRTTRTTHRTKLEQLNKEIARKRGQLDEVMNLQTSILNTEKKGLKELLEDVQRDIERLSKQRSDCRENINLNEIKLKKIIQDIADSKNTERNLFDNLQLRKKREESAVVEKEIERMENEVEALDIGTVKERLAKVAREINELQAKACKSEGTAAELKKRIKEQELELNMDMYKNANENYRKKFIDMKVLECLESDLQKFYVAYDKALIKYHSEKMAEINGIIKELWMRIYRGNDIDCIAIRTDVPPVSVTANADQRRVYNYRVVQIKRNTELDMRGRCSAGQKILSSLIIRMALAETLSLRCGILALDEPTANLDEANIDSLGRAILDIVERRMQQDNFQLIIITHDPHFIKLLSDAEFTSHYYEVSRNIRGLSVIKKKSCSEL